MNVKAALHRDARAWVAAGVGAAVLGLLFRPEIAAAVAVWNGSTAYGHCWLVLPIALWLLWDRRVAVFQHPARPAPWAALAAIPALLLWAASDLLGIMEGRQVAAVLLLLVLLLAVLGPALWWALSAGFLYLLFLVPFGAFVTPVLQRYTAWFITAGLGLLDIPYDANAMQITIPEGVFYVAEACAGLRFLIASIAFGVLYAVTMFHSPGRRAAFIAVACVVPVLANGVRGLGIVVLGHVLGSAQAGAADHLIYGWVFFSTVIVVLALAGLPFRQAAERPRLSTEPAEAAPYRGLRAAACVPVLLIAAAGPLLASRSAASVATRAPSMPGSLGGCKAGPRTASGGMSHAAFTCGDQNVQITGTILSHTAGPARVLAAAREPAMAGLGTDIDSEVWEVPDPMARRGAPWVVARAHDTGAVAAYAFQEGGQQGVGTLGDRLRLLRAVLDRTGDISLAWAVRITPGGQAADPLLHDVLAQLSGHHAGSLP